ncbi:MAG: glutamine-hydrolyzing GMP synthase [Proteobacteria bacterium]|nr:glutamine-hydrolyzing GMP synthase [Pseudomonadota bacterium]
MGHQLVWILDFGSQYTQLIARRVRELGVYCQIRPCTDQPPDRFPAELRALILSGGPASVLGDDAPPFSTAWFDAGVPLLGVCYGMQLMTHLFGGTVGQAESREYGLAQLQFGEHAGPVFADFAEGQLHRVWMSHGDHVEVPPEGFNVVARSTNGVIAAIADNANRRYGLQFHPEVTHTDLGRELLKRFVVDVAGASGDWTPGSFVEEQVDAIRSKVGDGQVICALSGGVDSSVVAALLHRAIGEQLHCIFVDNGLLRQNEMEEVRDEFSEYQLTVVDVRERFLGQLAGVSDPEKKRKIIGETFIRVFEEYARGINARWLAQGTLYPDVIESVSVRGPSATIKSHHNVGGLPEKMDLSLLEPLRELFKDEVRRVGEALGLSETRVWRQPFPGPGLAVRCLGPIEESRLATLRSADAIVREEIARAGWDRKIWQYFCALLPVRTVGVMGDERTYEEVCVVRAVHSVDGMTADWVHLPYEVLGTISNRIINFVPGINRVAYDISSKPPATIEWE